MRKKCVVCGNSYQAKRRDSLTCSATCRSNKREQANTQRRKLDDAPLVKATRAELEAAGKVDTMLGQQALILAARMAAVSTPSGVGALSKELSRVMAEAIGAPAPSTPAAGQGDDVDELRARRNAKRAAG